MGTVRRNASDCSTNAKRSSEHYIAITKSSLVLKWKFVFYISFFYFVFLWLSILFICYYFFISYSSFDILKVSSFLLFLFSTDVFYKLWKVLTVRRLFILSVVFRKHSQLTYNTSILATIWRKKTLCPHSAFKTNFSHAHFCFLGNYLYNKLNKSLPIKALPKISC